MASKKPIGTVTRGTTNPNRLRRVDRFIASLPIVKTHGCTVVDLGYGASPITAVELHERLSKLNASIRVVGVEIDRERVERGLAVAKPGLDFLLGGFETPLPPGSNHADVIRAFNVLRQYDESEVAAAWAQIAADAPASAASPAVHCAPRSRTARAASNLDWSWRAAVSMV